MRQAVCEVCELRNCSAWAVVVVQPSDRLVLCASFAPILYQAARQQAVGHRVTISFPDAVDELTDRAAAELGVPCPLHRLSRPSL